MARILVIRSKCASGIEPRVAKTARTLANAGHDVTVMLWDRDVAFEKIEKKDGYTIRRYRLKAPYGKASLLPKMGVWFYKVFETIGQEKPDIVHACDLDAFLPAQKASRYNKCKVVCDIFDKYSEMIVGASKGTRGFIRGVEDSVLSRCAAVIIADDTRRDQLNGVKIKRLEVIYNTPEDVSPEKVETEGFTIFYAGIIAKERGLLTISKAVDGLDGVNVVIAGGGPEQEELLPILKENPNVKFIGEIPFSEVLKREASADVLVALYDPSIPNNVYASPNKLFEAMMLSRPIIVSKGTNMEKIVATAGCGESVDFSDDKSLREMIIKLKQDNALREKYGAAGRETYDEKYSWPLMEEKIRKLYSELVK